MFNWESGAKKKNKMIIKVIIIITITIKCESTEGLSLSWEIALHMTYVIITAYLRRYIT